MKYCQTCGAELHDLAEICPKCGVRCAVMQPTNEPVQENKAIKGKGLGIVLGFFLGLIGAIICQFAGDEDAKKGGWIGFAITFAITIIYVVVSVILIVSSAGSYY